MKLLNRLLFSVFGTLLLVLRVSCAETPPETDDLIPIEMNGGRPFRTYCYHCPPPAGCEMPEGKLVKCPLEQKSEPGKIKSSERAVCYLRTETIVQNHTKSKTYIRLCTNVGAIKVNPVGTPINQELRISAVDLEAELKNATECFDVNEAELSKHAKKSLSCRYCDPTKEDNGCNENRGRSRKEASPSVALVSVLSLTALLSYSFNC